MDREQLRPLLRQRPFQPFRVHLTDGRTFSIFDPSMNLLGPSFIKIGIVDPNEADGVCEYTEFVPLQLIERVDLVVGSPPTASS